MYGEENTEKSVRVPLTRYVDLAITENKYEHLVWLLQEQRDATWNLILQVLGEETFQEDKEDE